VCRPTIRSNPKGVRLFDFKQLRDLLEHFGYLEVAGTRHGYSRSNALPPILLCIRGAKIRAWSPKLPRSSTGFRARTVAQRLSRIEDQLLSGRGIAEDLRIILISSPELDLT